MMRNITVSEDEKILIIAPHPDDESIGVGGLLCLYPQNCEVVVATDGRYGNRMYDEYDLINIRKNEFENAMLICNVNNFSFLNIKDKCLINKPECFAKIDFSKYDKIFLPNPKDMHSDHTAAYEYAMKFISKDKNTVASVYQYEVHGPLDYVDTVLDIGDIIDKKRMMIESYVSQASTHPYKDQVLALAEYRGCQNKQPGRLLEAYKEISKNVPTNLNQDQIELSKFRKFTDIMSLWIRNKRFFSDLKSYISNYKSLRIAIYGYGVLGKLLFDELYDDEITVEYIIDKNPDLKDNRIKIYHSLEQIDNVDIVIITTLFFYESIVNELKMSKKVKKCISLEGLLNEEGENLLG